MTYDEAVEVLKKRYEGAPKGEVALTIHLFGIEFADYLAELPISDVAEKATGHRSYGTEIGKGIRLARFVVLKDQS